MRDIDLTLYLVLDPVLCGGWDGMVRTAEAAAEAGATAVQLRAPGAKKRALYRCGLRLKAALAPFGVPLIVNDHADVALAVQAEGVHVGQSDLPVEAVRRLVGERMAIGLSISNAAELEAARGGCADHYGIGPVFDTATKPDAAPEMGFSGLAALCRAADRPAVAIGGLKARHAAQAIAAGAAGIAVVSAICGKPDPGAATRELLARVRQARLALR